MREQAGSKMNARTSDGLRVRGYGGQVLCTRSVRHLEEGLVGEEFLVEAQRPWSRCSY